jgi:hypothetical protein
LKEDTKCGCIIKSNGRACKLHAGHDTSHPGEGRCCYHEYPNPNLIRHESRKLPKGFCVCHSRYEKNALERLDSDSSVIRYKYEPYSIPYDCNNREDIYKPDGLVEYTDGKKILIEIKTKAEMSLSKDVMKYKENYGKFKAADLFAKERGIEFMIWVYDKWKVEVWSFEKFCQYTSQLSGRISIRIVGSGQLRQS